MAHIRYSPNGFGMPPEWWKMHNVGWYRGWILHGAILYIVSTRCFDYHLQPTMFRTQLLQLIRWDWIKNEPAFLDHHGHGSKDRLYSTAASMLKPPFLDTSLPHHELARWIGEHTVTIHHKLLPHIQEIRRSTNSKYVYELPSENSYWQELLTQEGETE